MRASFSIRVTCAGLLGAAAVCLAAAQDAPVVLDQVVAVVNNRAILSSDIDDELRLSAIEPLANPNDKPNAKTALEQLISRTLIQQQIRQEDEEAAQTSADDVQARLAELRKNLPLCVQANCTTDAGWKKFLEEHHLTDDQVKDYLRRRLEILSFIETRFRQGIRISPEDVESYYRDKLLPQYKDNAKAPPLDEVSARIEELLLQQQVNSLFTAWLENLRKQGDVEILDPALESALPSSPAEGGDNE